MTFATWRFLLLQIFKTLNYMNFLNKLFGMEDTSSQNLAGAISKGAFLVDVRSREEFQSGSAKGAVNIPLDSITQQLDRFRGKENIVVFCRSGNRSAQAKRILNEKGFKNVINGGTWQHVAQLVNEQ
jgi:rhodanese-related sulfurtransferase